MSLRETRLLPALLKFWRDRRGLSQLDLAVAAEVSSRHVSFLETGRAKPSREMLLRLCAVMEIPLRERNVMLHAAGLPAAFVEPNFEHELPAPVMQLFERMAALHEPLPLVITNRACDVLRANRGAERVLSHFVAEPSKLPSRLNVLDLLFDPQLARPFVRDWGTVAQFMLSRVQRELLARPHDELLARCAARLQAYPNVPKAWSVLDFSEPVAPALVLHLRRDSLELRFLTTITTLNAPQNVTLEELRIDTYYPLDDATTEACQRLAGEFAAP
ncbi:MAG: Transcriptional regulator, Cro/CI family protein [Myxococcaceae bacterium]|nr:Transcriptional regulator, Cro/CI family protein [Myxococcaceae bacterium]